MGGPATRRILLLRQQTGCCPKKRPLTRSYASMNTRSADYAHLPDPTPIDLLRATINASSKFSSTANPSTNFKQVDMLLDQEWKLGSPPAALWCALKGVHPLLRVNTGQVLQSATDLSALKRAAEEILIDPIGAKHFQQNNCGPLRQVLRRCERHSANAEILSTLNDITARLRRLGLPVYPRLYELAMKYAALDLLTSALRPLVQEYANLIHREPEDLSDGAGLSALRRTLDSVLFENPHYDARPILAELAGEGELGPRHQPTLWDIGLETLLQDRRNRTVYLCILARLGSEKQLQELWKKHLDGLDGNCVETCHSAYDVIASLIQARRSDTAVRFLEDISQRLGDNLPHLTTFDRVQPLVDDAIVAEAMSDLVKPNEYKHLLESRLEDIERRLAIRWAILDDGKDEGHVHRGIGQDAPWSVFEDHALLTIDGDSAGYDQPERLYFEIRANGCSKSVDTLGQLVSLLNEQDGNTLELSAPQDQSTQIHPGVELRWCPEHSPIEFSGSRLPTLYEHYPTWTPASLGLIRARSMIKGTPQGGTRCLHLLQTGSMEMRVGPDKPWQSSGYIVTWDRQYGELIALWVGKNYGVVDPGPTPSDAPFGTIMHIRTGQEPDELAVFANGIDRETMGPYYLDIDPGADLGFE